MMGLKDMTARENLSYELCTSNCWNPVMHANSVLEIRQCAADNSGWIYRLVPV